MKITDIRTKIANILSEDVNDPIHQIIMTVVAGNDEAEEAGFQFHGSFAAALIDVLVSHGVQAFPRGLLSGEGDFDYGDEPNPWDSENFDLADAMRADDKAELVIEPDGGVNAWLVGIPGFQNTDNGYGVDGLYDDYDEIVMAYSKNYDCAGIEDFTRQKMEAMVQADNHCFSPQWYVYFKHAFTPLVAQWRQSAPPG